MMKLGNYLLYYFALLRTTIATAHNSWEEKSLRSTGQGNNNMHIHMSREEYHHHQHDYTSQKQNNKSENIFYKKSPPYIGTSFVDSDIILEDSDNTTYLSNSYIIQEQRQVFDRREDAWVFQNVHIFNVLYDDSCSALVEFQVNTEFTQQEAQDYVEYYGTMVGQLGCALRESLQTVTIHGGTFSFGGGSGDLLIHVGQGELYAEDDRIGEILVHEACHLSIDQIIYDTTDGLEAWNQAVSADNNFYISEYAQDNPQTEDVAESFLLYYAVRYRPDSISSADYQTIISTIPNRMNFFDSKNFDLKPMFGTLQLTESDQDDDILDDSLQDDDILDDSLQDDDDDSSRRPNDCCRSGSKSMKRSLSPNALLNFMIPLFIMDEKKTK